MFIKIQVKVNIIVVLVVNDKNKNINKLLSHLFLEVVLTACSHSVAQMARGRLFYKCDAAGENALSH